MARLIYSAISSLDGYIEDTQGKFDWAVPDDEVHQFINNLEREAGTWHKMPGQAATSGAKVLFYNFDFPGIGYVI